MKGHSGLRPRLHNLVAAMLATAGVLLVVEHWQHFSVSDFTLLALILASLGIHLLTREPKRAAREGHDKDSPGHESRRWK